MPWCTQQVKWVTRSKCFEYSGLSNSKIGGNGVTARKCMCQEYSFDYLRMLVQSFAYINHRPSFDRWLHQYNIIEICHVMIIQRRQCHPQQQWFSFMRFPRHNSRPVGQWRYLLLRVKLPDLPVRLQFHLHWFRLAPDLLLLPLTCRVLFSWNFLSWTRSSTISCIICFLFLEQVSIIFCAGRLLLTCKWWTLLTPVLLP